MLAGDQPIPLPDVEVEVLNYRGSGRERVGLFRTDQARTAQMELQPGSYHLQLRSEKELPYLLVDKAWNKKSRGPRPSLLFAVSDAGVRKWEGERYVSMFLNSDVSHERNGVAAGIVGVQHH